MDFALSAEQRQFAASLHEMLAAAGVAAAARSWAAGDRKPGMEIWRSLADAGVTGLLIPASLGGVAGSAVDLVVACQEIGHHAVPGPAAESVAAVPVLLAGLPAGEQDAWLGQLCTGELIATLAAPPWLPMAADTDAAGLVLLATPDRVAVAEAGRTLRSVDAARTLATVREVAGAGALDPAVLPLALEYGAIACAAQLLGAGRTLLAAAAEHARSRVQFGQPIGSFQAVKHHLADALIKLEFAEPLLFGAAVALQEHRRLSSPRDADFSRLRRDVSAAKVACADAATLAARTALQVHGAIGYTAEHDISLFLTRVQALAPAWGSQAQHRARVLAAVSG